MRKAKSICLFGSATVVAITVIATFSAPVRGLSRRNVVEIRMASWQAASRDILPSLTVKAVKDFRATPAKVWFALRYLGLPSEPNSRGWVWCGILVPGNMRCEIVEYGAYKQNGHWVIKRVSTVPS